jgi:hypothetical protein
VVSKMGGSQRQVEPWTVYTCSYSSGYSKPYLLWPSSLGPLRIDEIDFGMQ